MRTIDTFNDGVRSFSYTVSQRPGTRQLRLSVRPGGDVRVSAPPRVSAAAIRRFIIEKAEWIAAAMARLAQRPASALSKGTRADYLRLKEAARELAQRRLEHFNRFYNFRYKRISIRDQKTRWGSCSPSGSLSFNYRIALLPPHLADYLVVHELCHLAQMNHSNKFWALVAKTVPDYATCRRELKHVA